ncbi:MAG: MurR/RpiR family transcriptional regulator [Beduini sp.]|uniref:MurR/RpiR family transcriptional regulator n=1 Tax=Beduini sp. TaxID=1922300 RepID=UPI00399FF137
MPRYIAEKLFTAPSTIVRLCQKIGFQGYNQFREAYLQEQVYLSKHFDHLDPNNPFDFQDKSMVIANKMGALYHEIIEDVLALLDHDHLQSAIRLLEEADFIYIFSLGVQLDIA